MPLISAKTAGLAVILFASGMPVFAADLLLDDANGTVDSQGYEQASYVSTDQVCADLKLVYPRSRFTEIVNVCHRPVFGKFID
jgi:hypothetical protein